MRKKKRGRKGISLLFCFFFFFFPSRFFSRPTVVVVVGFEQLKCPSPTLPPPTPASQLPSIHEENASLILTIASIFPVLIRTSEKKIPIAIHHAPPQPPPPLLTFKNDSGLARCVRFFFLLLHFGREKLFRARIPPPPPPPSPACLEIPWLQLLFILSPNDLYSQRRHEETNRKNILFWLDSRTSNFDIISLGRKKREKREKRERAWRYFRLFSPEKNSSPCPFFPVPPAPSQQKQSVITRNIQRETRYQN